MLPAQPGSGFVSSSPVFAGGDFSSSGLNLTPVFLLATHCHASPVQTQLSSITIQVMQTYGDWQLQLQSSRPCNFVRVETFFSGETVYFISPPVNPQHVPRFVNNANTGYQPVNENYAPFSANPNQISFRF